MPHLSLSFPILKNIYMLIQFEIGFLSIAYFDTIIPLI